GDDLIGSPELEILRRARDHLLALADLPAVGAEVAEQGVRVVELYGGAGERLFRPGFGAQRLDRGLVAAEGEADLGLADEDAGQFLIVLALPGGRLQAVEELRRLGELLLVDQAV